jgi:hypothetical protein
VRHTEPFGSGSGKESCGSGAGSGAWGSCSLNCVDDIGAITISSLSLV